MYCTSSKAPSLKFYASPLSFFLFLSFFLTASFFLSFCSFFFAKVPPWKRQGVKSEAIPSLSLTLSLPEIERKLHVVLRCEEIKQIKTANETIDTFQ